MSEREDGAIGAVDLLERLCDLVEREGDLPVYVLIEGEPVAVTSIAVKAEETGRYPYPRRVELS